MTNFEQLIARAAPNRFLTNEEMVKKGALIFKRTALGLFGRRSVKTSEDMAKLLYKTNIASSITEGRRIVPGFTGDAYYGGMILCSGITVERVSDRGGDKKYIIKCYSHD